MQCVLTIRASPLNPYRLQTDQMRSKNAQFWMYCVDISVEQQLPISGSLPLSLLNS